MITRAQREELVLMVAAHEKDCGAYQACCDMGASKGAQAITALLVALNAADALADAADRVAPTLRSAEHSHGDTQASCPFPLCRAIAAYRALVEPPK